MGFKDLPGGSGSINKKASSEKRASAEFSQELSVSSEKNSSDKTK